MFEEYFLALSKDDPEKALTALVIERRKLLSLDHTYQELEAVRARLREVGAEADEDMVMDVMDRVVGFCRPHARIT